MSNKNNIKIEFDNEFLSLHKEILNLSRKYINKSNFLYSFIDSEQKVSLLRCLLAKAEDGYILDNNTTYYKESKDEIFSKEDKYHRRKLKIDTKLRQHIDYFESILDGKINDLCVLHLTYKEETFTQIFQYMSLPSIIQGFSLNGMRGEYRKKQNKVTIILDHDTIYIQGNLDLKLILYQHMAEIGKINIERYKSEILEQMGLLWGVPPFPNKEQAKKIIENLSK